MKKTYFAFIIAVLALCAGIWYWKSVNSVKKEAVQQLVEQQLSSKEENQEQNLVWYQVPELDMEFQVEKSVADELIYTYQAHSKVDFGGVLFSAKELSQVPGCRANSGPLGALTKLKGKPSDYKDASYYLARNPKQFDGFFLYFEGPQAVCASIEHPDEYNEFKDFFKENPQFDAWSAVMFETMRRIN